MASLQNRNGSYRILFDYQRKQRTFTIGRVFEAEARAKADQVNYLLMRLSQGLIALPPGAREEDITATYKDGVLEVRAPAPVKAPDATAKKIRIDHT